MARFTRIGLSLVVLLALGGTASAPAVSKACWSAKQSEKRFQRLINDTRKGSSLHRLRLDPELSHAARKHSGVMLRKDRLFHTIGLGRRITRWQVLGENVGYGIGVQRLHNVFLDSQGHYLNIIHSGYRHVGVGVQKDGDKIWVSVIFEGKGDPGTSLDMPACHK